MLNAKFRRTLSLGNIEALYKALEERGHKPPWNLKDLDNLEIDDLIDVERQLRELLRTIPNG